jgi:cytochrome c-type biogenesis protein CcmH
MERIEAMQRSSVFRIFACFIVAAFLIAVGWADEASRNAKKAREIEDNLIAPCCWMQPVSEHYSEVAEKIRKEVQDMVAAGKSRDEILDYYVSQYGERILATPRAKGFNALAYVLPWLALALGAWLLVLLLKKLRSPAVAPNPAPVPDSRYTAAVEQEIKDLEE